MPFQGTFYSGLPRRNYLPYGRELLDGGLERAAVMAFERAAEANPGAPTLYRLGTLLARSGETVRARAAFERALVLQPDLAEANNDLGALLAQGGDLDAAISRFRAALASTPEYPDALNNLGYALLLTGRDQEARALYEKALALQPDFPEVLNNLGCCLAGRATWIERSAISVMRSAVAQTTESRQQSRARVRFERAGGRGCRPSSRRSDADTGVRGRLRDAGKDPLQRRPFERGDRRARTAAADESEACSRTGTAPAMEGPVERLDG